MSRNSSGTHTLPAGNPVVSGTTISSTVANATLADISAEITDSLSRSGKGGMTAPFRVVDGTAAAPSLSFTNETGSGLYRAAASDVGVAIAGTRRLRIQATGVTVPDALTVTGAATVGTTLGVTGAISGASIGVTGAATVGTTLGVTGKTTLTGDLEVQGASIAITTGDVTLTQASSDQTILKSSGSLNIGTTDTNSLRLQTNGSTRFTILSTGDMQGDGTSTITNLPDPAADGEAANKGYVDGQIEAMATYGTLASPIALSASTWTNVLDTGATVSPSVPANSIATFECMASFTTQAVGTVGSMINVRILASQTPRMISWRGEFVNNTTRTEIAFVSAAATTLTQNGVVEDFTGSTKTGQVRVFGSIMTGANAATLTFQAYRDSSTAVSVTHARCDWKITP